MQGEPSYVQRVPQVEGKKTLLEVHQIWTPAVCAGTRVCTCMNWVRFHCSQVVPEKN